MKDLEQNFKYKGVDFEIIKKGEKAVMLRAKADFYDCDSIEVWYLRYSKDRIINGVFVSGGVMKPSNEDYPYRAHQFLRKYYSSDEEFLGVCEKRFEEYETGLRPKAVIGDSL